MGCAGAGLVFGFRRVPVAKNSLGFAAKGWQHGDTALSRDAPKWFFGERGNFGRHHTTQIVDASWPAEKLVLFVIIKVLTSNEAVSPLPTEHRTQHPIPAKPAHLFVLDGWHLLFLILGIPYLSPPIRILMRDEVGRLWRHGNAVQTEKDAL